MVRYVAINGGWLINMTPFSGNRVMHHAGAIKHLNCFYFCQLYAGDYFYYVDASLSFESIYAISYFHFATLPITVIRMTKLPLKFLFSVFQPQSFMN